MWMIYLALRKVAFHAFNQKLRDYITVKQFLTYSSRERKPSTRHDPGICPHCGEVSTYRKSFIISRPFIVLDPNFQEILLELIFTKKYWFIAHRALIVKRSTQFDSMRFV